MATENPQTAAAESRPPAGPRPKRPNYNQIHRNPLPLTIDALPPLIPHNPLSVLAIAFSYALSLLRTIKQPVYQGIWSPETRSVHVTDKVAIRALWESGFFGKGTLSRSEPTWLSREKARRGLVAGETSEDFTRKRRLERAEFKRERARKEREEIEATLKRERERKGGAAPDLLDQPNGNVPEQLNTLDKAQASAALNQPETSPAPPPRELGTFTDDEDALDFLHPDEGEVIDLEHLQLTLEEAFFLSFALGVLEIFPVVSNGTVEAAPIPRASLFQLFQAHSTFRPSAGLQPHFEVDDRFLVNYAVYHHFRALGWVVRPGIKFAVDWMLYNRGPVFSHAEFAVITIPSYSHPGWKGMEVQNRSKSWHWLHMVNRVQSQVRKSLVLAFVEVPPPAPDGTGRADDPLAILSTMSVRGILLKRWIPNRNRD